MDIFVKTASLEDLSEELRQMGNNIYEITSNYNTLIYEILNETEDDQKEEIETIANEIKEFLDEGFITVKKHENFIISAIEEYELTEKDIVGNAEAIANTVYSGRSTYVSPGYTPVIDILPFVNPSVIPLIRDNLPNGDVNRIDRKDRNPVKIVGLINEIIKGNGKRYEYTRALMGLIGLIAPGAIMTGLSDIYPGFRPSEFTGLTNTDDDLEGGGGNGYGGRSYDDIVKLIGQGFQTNYNLIEALRFAFILTELIKAGFNIGELGNYNTLSDITGRKNGYSQDNGDIGRTEDEEPEEDKDNEDEETNDESEDKADESSENTDDSDSEEIGTENNRSYDYSGLNTDTSYGNYENEDAEVKTYSSDIKSGSENAAYETADDLSETVASETENTVPDETVSEQDLSGSGGGSGGSSGSSGSGGLGASGLGISSLNTDDDTVSAAQAQQAESKVNYKSKSSNANDIYSRILASIYGNESSDLGRKSAAALAGTGAAALGGMGTLASIASGTASGSSGAVLNQIAGALSFNNLFDFVGNAQVCSIDWLSELTNVLAAV